MFSHCWRARVLTAQGAESNQSDSRVLWTAHSTARVWHSPADADTVGAVGQAQLAALFYTHYADEDNSGLG